MLRPETVNASTCTKQIRHLLFARQILKAFRLISSQIKHNLGLSGNPNLSDRDILDDIVSIVVHRLTKGTVTHAEAEIPFKLSGAARGATM
jgi:hypothetical protein